MLAPGTVFAESIRLLLPADAPASPDNTALTAALSRVANQSVEIVTSSNELNYLHAIDETRFDLLLAQPHIAGSLIQARKARLLALRNVNEGYLVAVRRRDESIFQVVDLSGRRLCIEKPGLFPMVHLTGLIDNITREPVMIKEPDYRRRVRQLLSDHCHAIMLSVTEFKSLTKREGSDRLRVIYQSNALPGDAILINARLPRTLSKPLHLWLLGPEAHNLTGQLGTRGQSDVPWIGTGVNTLKSLSYLANDLLLLD